jgi:hypothetical protein
MQGTKVPLHKWIWAIELMCARKLITSAIVSRELMVSHPTAELMILRVQDVAGTRAFQEALLRVRRNVPLSPQIFFWPLLVEEAVLWMLHGPNKQPTDPFFRMQ